MMSDVFKRLRAKFPLVGMLLLGLVLGATIFAREKASEKDPTHQLEKSETETIWTCSMHPQVRQHEPGKCPLCGMDLIPTNDGSGGDLFEPNKVTLSKRARALARIRTVRVERLPDATGQLRLLGRIVANERTQKTVTAWTGGRIDTLHLKVTGERVRRGQAIATLYSPEIFSAHQDLITASRQLRAMASAGTHSRLLAESSMDASRDRLRLLGVDEDTLRRLEAEEKPTTSLIIRSPFFGTVIERLATEGSYVTTGASLYHIADLRTLWVQLEAYESDLPKLQVGQVTRMTTESLPDDEFIGEIAFIEPTVDPRRRVAQVRVELKNPNGRLRPGMFMNAVIDSDLVVSKNPLVIPQSAPLFTGRRSLVYVESKRGDRSIYGARTVLLGSRLGDVYPVVSGLTEGERVVIRGAFAIDADLQIRGGQSMMMRENGKAEDAVDVVVELSEGQRAKIAPVLNAYINVQEALAADDLDGAQWAARAVAHAIEVKLGASARLGESWGNASSMLRAPAEHISSAKDLEGARVGFEMLSEAASDLLRTFGNPLEKDLRLAYCPMARGGAGASWIQSQETIDNAYFGKSMRSCGEVKEVIGVGQHMSVEVHTPPTESAHR